VIVVPCFNEERRLDTAAFTNLANTGRLNLLFVDDGSTDRTAAILNHLCGQSTAMSLMTLPTNVGKGEAVRRGMLQAAANGAAITGYYDADLSTPPAELLRLIKTLSDRPPVEVIMGSRVQLLGRAISRSPVRHYLSRVFATLVSLALRIPVYDTQCGAKVFRVTPALQQALNQPFRSRWGFDVELIGRLLRGHGAIEPVSVDAFIEVPLREYKNAPNSKLRPIGIAHAVTAVLQTGIDLRRGRG
jgi:glycosyltransferase involved in cell wall biosynthesis